MHDQTITIGQKKIGKAYQPFIIAEMSGNHNQSLERALKIVEAAAEAGCDALKLQTYTADSLTIDCDEKDFSISSDDSLWKGQTLYSLYGKASTPWDWHEKIFQRGKELGLTVFSSPFDETAVDFLERLGAPAYKIASFENNHLPLIRKAAATQKPLIISTGMATVEELQEAVNAAREAGCRNLILLKCTSTYPASAEDSHLNTLPDLREQFKVETGLSDHTPGIGVSVAAVALGATVIEKHFTLDRNEGGVDAAFSMEPAEMQLLVEEAKKAWQALGSTHYGPTGSEQKSLMFRRSIYAVEDIRAGEDFNMSNVRIIRPGFGLPPKHYERIIGKKSNTNIKRGTPMEWDFVQK